MLTLGIDTSNYATSLAVFDTQAQEVVCAVKRFLPVKPGERGLRHIACQTAQTGLHAMRPGIASGDGQSGRTEVQQQALPAGALCEEGDADAA